MVKRLLILIAVILIFGCLGDGSSSSPASDTGSGSRGSSEFSSSASASDNSGVNPGIQTYHNPEPSSIALLAIGLAGLGIRVLRKRKNTKAH